MKERLVGRVSQVWWYPVKSMQGVSLAKADAALVSWAGMHGDRALVVVDHGARVITAKQRLGRPLLMCRTEIRCGRCLIYLPGDNQAYVAMTPAADRALSELLHMSVRLQAVDPHQGARETNAGFQLRPGVGYDSSPLHVITTASVRALSGLCSLSEQQAVSRFRPNIVIETEPSLAGFVEQGWAQNRRGITLNVGPHAQIVVRKATERCALPAQPQPGMDQNPQLLQSIHEQCDNLFGMYAVVRNPGAICLEDRVGLVMD